MATSQPFQPLFLVHCCTHA